MGSVKDPCNAWSAYASGFVALGHDLNRQRAVLPEHVMNAGLQIVQHVRAHVVESEHDGRTFARTFDALNRIERRKPVAAKKRLDFLVARFVFDIAYPKLSHNDILLMESPLAGRERATRLKNPAITCFGAYIEDLDR
jgi:hypothetical protein